MYDDFETPTREELESPAETRFRIAMRYTCSDRMCGAEDCENCRPGCTERLAEQEAAAEEEAQERLEELQAELGMSDAQLQMLQAWDKLDPKGGQQ